MTKITWYNDGETYLTCYADHKKTEIKFHFNDSNEVTLLSVDQTEFSNTDENLVALFVCINGEFMSLYELMLIAENEYPDIRKDEEESAMAESEHRRIYSTPGRI